MTAQADSNGRAEGSKGLFGFVTDNPSSRSVRPCGTQASVRAEGSLQGCVRIWLALRGNMQPSCWP